MIRGGFLSAEDRADLIDSARDGSSAHRLGRRANALLLLDEGWSCEQVAKALFLDDDTIRSWYRLYQKDGILGLARHGPPGLSCQINVNQQEKLRAWVLSENPSTTRQMGNYISQ